MRILMTGATGFLGRNLIPALENAQHKMTAMLLPEEKNPFPASVRIVRGDITRPESLRHLFHDQHGVVHLAGAVGYGQEMDRCIELNVEGTRNIADAAVNAGVQRFIHFSSVSVYGRVHNIPVTEDTPFKKTGDPYGDTKIDAELLLQEFQKSGQLDLTVFRPTVIYGPGDDKFLPKLLENLRSGKARIIGDGQNRVDLIHVNDVTDAVISALDNFRSIGKVYNLNNPDNPTWESFLQYLSDLLDVPAPERYIPYPTALILARLLELAARLTGNTPRLTRYAVRVIGRPYDYKIDKIRKELGFRCRINLRTGLQDCLTELRQQG